MAGMTEHAERLPRRLPPAERGRTQDRSRDDLIVGAALALLVEKGYGDLTMTDVATRAGVSKATLYRRWTSKADLVADAVATLNPMKLPLYPGTSLRDDLLALMEQAGSCDGRPDIVVTTMEMARSQPDLYRTLAKSFATLVRVELGKLVNRAADEGAAALSELELDVLADTAVALLAHHAGPEGESVPHERLISMVDNVLMVLITGKRGAG